MAQLVSFIDGGYFFWLGNYGSEDERGMDRSRGVRTRGSGPPGKSHISIDLLRHSGTILVPAPLSEARMTLSNKKLKSCQDICA